MRRRLFGAAAVWALGLGSLRAQVENGPLMPPEGGAGFIQAPLLDLHETETLPAALTLSIVQASLFSPEAAAGKLLAALPPSDAADLPKTAAALKRASLLLQNPRASLDPRRELQRTLHEFLASSPALRALNKESRSDQLEIARRVALESSYAGQAAFFDILQAYGHMEDDYDRGPSHLDFLKNTSTLRSDKAELLGYAVGPTVLELGPGGGANLAYLDRRRREDPSLDRLIAVEASGQTTRDLQRLHADGRLSAEILQGNALNLKETLAQAGIEGMDTLLLSSVLHEVFSYCVYKGRRYNLDSVKEVLRGGLSLLHPGGRLLIRDPVEPEDGERWQKLVLHGRAVEAFRVFAGRFQARPLPYVMERKNLNDAEVPLRKKDVAEFIYKLSWGPQSFPYELREQYGVLSRKGWLQLIEESARLAGASIRFLPLPESLVSYLQPGYRRHLDFQIELHEPDGNPAAWPDSNMAIVVEKVS